MRYQKSRMILYGIYLLAGLGIVVASIWLDDHSFWGGIGGGLMGVGGVRLFQGLRYRKEPEFAKKSDYAFQDERMQYLAQRARSATFLITVFALALVSIILRFCQLEVYANVCAWVMMAMLAIYFVTYWLLGKKY